jgi:hypothetical protein
MTGSHRAEETSKARIAVVGALTAGALLLAPLGVALATPGVAYALPASDDPGGSTGPVVVHFNIKIVPHTVKIDPPKVVPFTVKVPPPKVVPFTVKVPPPKVKIVPIKVKIVPRIAVAPSQTG